MEGNFIRALPADGGLGLWSADPAHQNILEELLHHHEQLTISTIDSDCVPQGDLAVLLTSDALKVPPGHPHLIGLQVGEDFIRSTVFVSVILAEVSSSCKRCSCNHLTKAAGWSWLGA